MVQSLSFRLRVLVCTSWSKTCASWIMSSFIEMKTAKCRKAMKAMKSLNQNVPGRDEPLNHENPCKFSDSETNQEAIWDNASFNLQSLSLSESRTTMRAISCEERKILWSLGHMEKWKRSTIMQLPGSYRILLLNSQVLALTPEVVWQEHVKSRDDHTKPPEIAHDFDSCKKCSRVDSRTQASEDWTLNLWTLNLPRLRWRSSLAESMVTTSWNFRSDCPKEWCKLPTKKIKKT